MRSRGRSPRGPMPALGTGTSGSARPSMQTVSAPRMPQRPSAATAILAGRTSSTRRYRRANGTPRSPKWARRLSRRRCQQFRWRSRTDGPLALWARRLSRRLCQQIRWRSRTDGPSWVRGVSLPTSGFGRGTPLPRGSGRRSARGTPRRRRGLSPSSRRRCRTSPFPRGYRRVSPPRAPLA